MDPGMAGGIAGGVVGVMGGILGAYFGLKNTTRPRERKEVAVYEVDERDTVIALHDAPQPDVGAPLPHLVCDEHHILLAYLINEPDPAWDGSHVNIVGPGSDGHSIAVVRFERPYAQMFGPPNDEAFHGHPLSARGLRPYAVFEIKNSSWLRRLERMNSVHPYHDRERFLANRRHFIFAFHDTTFECIAQEFTFEIIRGSMRSVLPRLLAALSEGEPNRGAEWGGGAKWGPP